MGSVSISYIIYHLYSDWLQNQLPYLNKKVLYHKKIERLFLNDEMYIDDMLVYDKKKLEGFIRKLIDNNCGSLTTIIEASIVDNDIEEFQTLLDMTIKIENPTIVIKHFEESE